MNRVDLVGNLTKDPELKRTSNGTAVCSFTLAVNRKKNKDGISETDYITIQTWRTTAENCAKYLAKGRKVAVCGELRTRNYEKDGRKVYVTEVLAHEVEFISPKGQPQEADAAHSGYPEQYDESASGFTPVSDDELPF